MRVKFLTQGNTGILLAFDGVPIHDWPVMSHAHCDPLHHSATWVWIWVWWVKRLWNISYSSPLSALLSHNSTHVDPSSHMSSIWVRLVLDHYKSRLLLKALKDLEHSEYQENVFDCWTLHSLLSILLGT